MADDKIRVLHIITRLDRGGSADNTLITVSSLDRRRFDVALIAGRTTNPSPKLSQAVNKVEYEELSSLIRPVNPVKDIVSFFALFRRIRKGRYHIVHTHSSKAGFLGRLAAYFAGTPYIVHTPHGHIFYGYYGRIISWLFILLERFVSRFTDVIIGLTGREVKEHLERKIGKKSRFVVIPSGVELERFFKFDVDQKKVKKELNIPAKAKVIGSVGRLVPIKDPLNLIIAGERIAKEYPEIHFIWVGDGPLRARAEELARRASLPLTITGMKDDIRPYLAIVDIFVLPSLNEGMGRAAVEAMAMGKPVVATKVGGLPEVVVEGETGFLVPPADPDALAQAILSLLRYPDLGERLGRKGRERASLFSASRMVKEIEKVYLELVGEGGRE